MLTSRFSIVRAIGRLLTHVVGASLVFLGDVSPALAYRTVGDLEDFAGTERIGCSGGITSFVLVDDVPGAVGGTDVNAELTRIALRSWSDAECSSAIGSLRSTTSAKAVHGDGVNSIQWVRSGWDSLGFQPGPRARPTFAESPSPTANYHSWSQT